MNNWDFDEFMWRVWGVIALTIFGSCAALFVRLAYCAWGGCSF